MPPKASPLTPEDKLRVVMLCIKHSPAKLTPDYEAVYQELEDCGTKDAAYWRFVRIMKEYGMTASGQPIRSDRGGATTAKATPAKNKGKADTTPSKPDKSKATGSAGNPKKRKADANTNDSEPKTPTKKAKVEKEEEFLDYGDEEDTEASTIIKSNPFSEDDDDDDEEGMERANIDLI